MTAPVPPEAIEIFPGCALASAMNSLMLCTLNEGFTNRNIGDTPIVVTGAKSFTGSYGTFA